MVSPWGFSPAVGGPAIHVLFPEYTKIYHMLALIAN